MPKYKMETFRRGPTDAALCRKYRLNPLGWIAFAALLLLPVVCRAASSSEGPNDEGIESRIVVIESKGGGAIFIEGRPYRVEDTTLILDAEGRETTLCDLTLPCEADVSYRFTEDLEFLCIRIETLQVLAPRYDFVIVDDPG